MLRRSKLHLDESQSRELHACTGGWPAGVRLATAALHGGADPNAFLGRCSAAPEPVADFLVDEVLAVLPVADRDLLAATSLGGPITADLAAALSGRSDAGEVLDRLSRDTGLVQRGSAGRFRVHPLVPPHLRAALARWEGRAADLHRRSARWWAAHDDPLAAIQHAVRADDTDLLVELVHRFTGLLLVTGHHPVLGQVLSRLGESVVAGDPWLTLTATLTRIEAGGDSAPMDTPGDPVALPADGPEPSQAAARLAVLTSITGLFAAASTADLGATPSPVDVQRSRRRQSGMGRAGSGWRGRPSPAGRRRPGRSHRYLRGGPGAGQRAWLRVPRDAVPGAARKRPGYRRRLPGDDGRCGWCGRGGSRWRLGGVADRDRGPMDARLRSAHAGRAHRGTSAGGRGTPAGRRPCFGRDTCSHCGPCREPLCSTRASGTGGCRRCSRPGPIWARCP